MYTLARQSVEICGKRSHEGLTFTRTHLCDTSLMQSDTADKLNVEVAHTKHSFARFSHHCECVGENVVERFTAFDPLFEHVGLCGESVVVHSRIFRSESLDFIGNLIEFFDLKFVFVKKCHIPPLYLVIVQLFRV